MFLKALTIKGFKSFADKTVLDFEPGVTVVVGPNGSGKSNLVDAVAWVLGAQGPRTLRGGKMDDVIFAGTSQRPALGRAEVALTIDNTAGLLPIEFDEVTISRTLFRSGDSEYQINGVPCRLLDITDLLSDSGIGRQQHVIVGQGQLDTVLNARPEDRRSIIEEAAGVLKFRKRREKAERRLVATEGNLLRLNDLVREVRRQLRPLEKQADAARRHDGVDAERRAIRLHLAGRDLESMERRLEAARTERTRLAGEDEALRTKLRDLDDAVTTTERTLVTAGDDDLAEMLARVEALRERGNGLRALALERERGLEMSLTAAADAGVVETLVADADALRRELAALDTEHDDLAATIADGDAEAELAEATSTLRAAERAADRARARAEALAAALEGATTPIASVAGLDVTVGALGDLLRIDEGMEAAVGAALGDALHAAVVRSGDGARRVFEHLAEAGDDTPVGLLVPEGGRTLPATAPAGSRRLAEVVEVTAPEVAGLVERMLDGVVLVDRDWRDALDLALAHPELVVVTPSGARFGGSDPWRVSDTRHATRATVDAATAEAERADGAIGTFAARVEEAREHATRRRAAEMRLTGLDARRTLLGARLGEVEARLASRDEAAQAEAQRRRDALVVRLEECSTIRTGLDDHAQRVAQVHGRVVERRRLQSEAARRSAETLESLRGQRRELETQLAETRELANRAEITEAETRLRHETAIENLRADHDCEPDVAKAAPAPEIPEGVTLAGRARELERELKLMGPINPLALVEFEALTERHEFLQGQLDDVKESRRELQRVIRAVDREIVAVFEEAFADVEKNFSALFTTLFPGGSGRIYLTAPDDPLNTGIEMEARPSGKNVRRLSLLSGGERSLTAMAFLFAVFRARPSPFYLMDEVEAALDDVNLHRFLDLVHEFRDEAQLLIVSHQKRTMEAADLLYGVSMPPGGSSRVVSQRIEDHQEELVLD